MGVTPYTHKVQFYETDQMGVVHHSNYIRWFEEARVDYMDQIGFGYQKSTAAGVDFAVTGVGCDYKAMARFGDTVEITMHISLLTPSRMTIAYQIADSQSGRVYVTGETRHCYFHAQKNRPVSLKKELPELYALLESYCET